MKRTGLALLLLPLACASSAPDPGDPWEGFNRGVFAFNEALDQKLIGPAATAWDWLLPEPLVVGLNNVYRTADRPFILAHDLLQAEPRDAGEDLLRLLANLTLGLGGLVDAADALDIPDHREDWGLTLARWSVPSGPYLVLPVLGPSNVRDGLGFGMDSASRPLGYFIPFWQSFTIRAVDVLNLRAIFREEIEANRREAFDFYIFQRNLYRERRAYLRRDERPVSETGGESIYYLDESGDESGAGDDSLYYPEEDEGPVEREESEEREGEEVE